MGRTRNIANLVSDNMLSIDTSGNIGFATETPSKTLDVVGILSTSQLSGGHYGGSVTSSSSVTNNFNTTGIITTTGLLTGDGSALTGIAFTSVAILQDVKNQNTGGGSLSARFSYYDRDLNTIISDEHNIIVSLSSPNFTLGPGLYQIRAIVPAVRIGHVWARIYNTTDSIILAEGFTGWTNDTWRVATHTTVASHIFEITSNKSYKIQQTNTDTGGAGAYELGYYLNVSPEHYTIVYILKGNN